MKRTTSENTIIVVCWTHIACPSCKLMYVTVQMTARQLTGGVDWANGCYGLIQNGVIRYTIVQRRAP